jgi:capsular polysaccharide transport system permease protein
MLRSGPKLLLSGASGGFFALMLRNIRTRFFGNGLGYVLTMAWPLSHIFILVIIFTVMGRAAPYGDSPALFVATGVVPFWASHT